jgi:hypothetical protein
MLDVISKSRSTRLSKYVPENHVNLFKTRRLKGMIRVVRLVAGAVRVANADEVAQQRKQQEIGSEASKCTDGALAGTKTMIGTIGKVLGATFSIPGDSYRSISCG